TMLITLKETLSSLQDAGMRPGARVLVVGDGAVGLAFAYWAKVMGASKAVVAGHHENRLAHARKLGLDAAVSSSGRTLSEAVASDPAAAGPFDLIIDAVGHHKIVEEGIPLLAAWGTLAVYGTSTHLTATVDVMAIPVGARLLRASTDEPRVHTQVLEACRLGLICPSDFYSHVLPLEQAADGLELLRRREALKVVVVMG
ncbi:MAG: zinc-binding dehydrogenase, partial [Armatimonadetes bacterium]|nr:zinc-binding dehydrogenase [Armatimonadota bacterium]